MKRELTPDQEIRIKIIARVWRGAMIRWIEEGKLTKETASTRRAEWSQSPRHCANKQPKTKE